MRAQVRELQQRLHIWMTATASSVRSDDRGAVTTETAIITALIGGAALLFGGFVATRIAGWQVRIPAP